MFWGPQKRAIFEGSGFLGEQQQVPHFGVFVLMVDPLPLPLGGGYPGDVVIPDEKPL